MMMVSYDYYYDQSSNHYVARWLATYKHNQKILHTIRYMEQIKLAGKLDLFLKIRASLALICKRRRPT
jgi:hypothetical protein